jgi:hypothetical protein
LYGIVLNFGFLISNSRFRPDDKQRSRLPIRFHPDDKLRSRLPIRFRPDDKQRSGLPIRFRPDDKQRSDYQFDSAQTMTRFRPDDKQRSGLPIRFCPDGKLLKLQRTDFWLDEKNIALQMIHFS